MPRDLIFDLADINLEEAAFDKEAIRAENLQRFEMEQLDGVIHVDLEGQRLIGYKDVREDEFWVRGHIPGRPILPGTMIVEAAAQLCSFYFKKHFPDEQRFLGFSGIEEVRFRGSVVPGDRLLVLAKARDLRRRRAIFGCQAVVAGKIVFEGVIIGMPI
jgi:3-hydroxyacyl-[acyl-carrier-protein] dehydratase